MQRIVIFFLLTALLTGQGSSHLLAQKPRFARIGVADGLSQSSVLSLHRDAFGYMWMGTRDGLNMYDATTFRLYRHNPSDSSTIGGNTINSIASAEEGNLWLAHNRGLSFLDRRSNTFTHYPTPAGERSSPELRFVSLIDGEVYACGWSGVFVVDSISGKLRRPQIQAIPHEYLNESASAIYRDHSGRWWLATTRSGLFVFDHSPASPVVYANREGADHHLGEDRIEALHFEKGGGCYIATYGNGIYRVDSYGSIDAHWHEGSSPALSNNFVRCLAEDQNQRIWAGTFKGVNILNPKNGTIEQVRNLQSNEDQARNVSVRSLLADEVGSVWVGTYHEGLGLYDPFLFRFAHFSRNSTPQQDPAADIVAAFAEDDKGCIYAGMERGGIDIYNTKTGEVSHIALPEIGNENTELLVKSMHHDQNTGLLIGTFRAGLYRFDPANNRFRNLILRNIKGETPLNDDLINCITPARDGRHHWLGTDKNGGLHLADLREDRLVSYAHSDTLSKLINKAPVRHVLQDRIGNVWLATKGAGLIGFHPVGGVFIQIKDAALAELNQVYEDTDGVLWLSTNGNGLCQFDPKRRSYSCFNSTDGLLSNTVFGCREDAEGNIWAGVFNGISRLDSKNEGFKNYDYSRGFPLFELNEGAVFQDAAGQLLFGGKRGWTIFDPAELSDNERESPVVLTDIKVLNTGINNNPDFESLSVAHAESLTLSHDEDVLTFEFACLNYINPSNNSYAYMLEGFDKGWVYCGRKRDASYTNLPEGDYTFRVRGSNNDGVWSNSEVAFALTVLPPPWRTWWAFMIYASFIFGGVLLIRANALRSARLRENLRMGALEKTRIEENHKLKLQFFTDVSHEIRTPLTLIVNPLEDMLRNDELPEQVHKPLKTMRYNIRRLLLLVNQLLELRKLEIGKQQVVLQAVSLDLLLQRICDAYRGMADKTQIKLTYEADLEQGPVMLDTDKMEKILLNILSNAFKFTPAGGEVKVLAKSIKVDDRKHHFVVSIADTGVGIPRDEQQKVFERFYKGGANKQGSGIGLSLVKSLADLLGGGISLESATDKGAKFTLEFTFSQAEENAAVLSMNQTIDLPPEYIVPVREDPGESHGDKKGGELILLVEDNEDLRSYMREKLREKYSVKEGESAEEGLRKARKYNPDVIISDIMLPGMDGLEMCRELKADLELSHIPIIMVTAKQGDDGKLEGLRTGADDYIIKPFMMEELEMRVANILKMRRKLRRHYRHEGSLPESAPALPDHDKKMLEKLNVLIEKHLREPNLSVERLSQELGLSRVHLYRKLKALTDMSPTTYIRRFRLRRAETMLRNRGVRVSEVAYEVGFQDINYFSKCFKKEYGKLPSEWSEVIAEEGPEHL